MEQNTWDFPETQTLWPCSLIRVSREGLTVWFDTNVGDAKCLYVQGPVKRSVFWQTDSSADGYDSGVVMRSMMVSNPDALITSLVPEHAIHLVFDTARYIIKELPGSSSGAIEYSISTWSSVKPDGNQALVTRTQGVGEPVTEDEAAEVGCSIC
jgi:hypothetical protein